MSKFVSAVKTFINDENGITAVEYALMAALMAAGLVLAVTVLTAGLKDAFTLIANKIKTPLP